MKKFIYLITFIILLIITIIATYKISKNLPDEVPVLKEGETDTSFFKVRITIPEFTLSEIFSNDKNFTKRDLEGKYSLVNFFASWCTTCQQEHEILLRLKDEGVIDLYGIAWRDGEETARQYLEEYGNPFAKVVSDTSGLFSKLANIQAIPETWIIDKKGNVVMRYRGNLQEFSIDEIKNFLKNNK
jgi:cytochrome c biogenesis protein CcmG/thiol:disulfide interchange protein DsbE